MNTEGAIGNRPALARVVIPDSEGVSIALSDGRSLRIAFADYAFLRSASPGDRANCYVDDHGTAIFWPALVEGISVAGLLGVSEARLDDHDSPNE